MTRILLALAVILVVPSLPAAMPPGDAAPDGALMQEINDAWCSLDPEKAAPYYDHAPGDVFHDVAPLKYTGWASYAGGARDKFRGLRSMKYTVGNDAAVHVAGNTAWGTATLHLVTVDTQDRKQEVDLRWTTIWEKKDSRWLLVHEHLSAPAP